MLPLSRPLFERENERHVTLAVAASLVTATLVILATLTSIT